MCLWCILQYLSKLFKKTISADQTCLRKHLCCFFCFCPNLWLWQNDSWNQNNIWIVQLKTNNKQLHFEPSVLFSPFPIQLMTNNKQIQLPFTTQKFLSNNSAKICRKESNPSNIFQWFQRNSQKVFKSFSHSSHIKISKQHPKNIQVTFQNLSKNS